jgi:hypothetical protein
VEIPWRSVVCVRAVGGVRHPKGGVLWGARGGVPWGVSRGRRTAAAAILLSHSSASSGKRARPKEAMTWAEG